jgi:CRISPR system Cascade subunit CasB
MTLSPTGATAWWRDLQRDPDRNQPGDRAGLARLRRCSTVTEAMQDQATIALFHRCGGNDFRDLPVVGLAAAVLAHVRKEKPGDPRVARQVGPDNTDRPETALLKPGRFRRLLDADTPDERLIAFRRLVALAGGELNVRDLADALLRWNESRKTRWVFDYWNAGPSHPTTRQAEEAVT